MNLGDLRILGRERTIPFVIDTELGRKLTKLELIRKLSSYENEVVDVSYRNKTGRNTTIEEKLLTNFTVEESEQKGVNIVTLYLSGLSKPLLLYQSNQEIVLDDTSNLSGRLTLITPIRRAAA